jgi:eukaryotic-like serine/threonine-protein kinase
MNPERWKLIKETFNAVLDQEPLRRDAFLNEACSNDELLRREVASLLAAHASNNFIDRPVNEVAADMFLSDQIESLIGRKIGNYRIEREIGRGGMGEVFLAQDLRLDRFVALKILPARSIRDQERARRFRQEARAISALNHPNIVTIHEIGNIDSLQFIVTEYIVGKTLREYISERKLGLAQMLDIAVQTANALAAAHQAGIVHRDIKPENIMVRQDGYVKVLDFGLAKLTEQPAISNDSRTFTRPNTHPGMIMGTTRYMSPEQARGQDVDARSDIFSFGVLLYELASGRVPFDGETNSDVIVAILNKEALPLTIQAPNAPKEFEWIVSKAIRKNKDERYQTIGEILSDIEGLRRETRLQSQLDHEVTAVPMVSEITDKQGKPDTDGRVSILTTEIREQKTSRVEKVVVALKRRTGVLTSVALSLALIAGSSFGLYRWLGAGSVRSQQWFDKIKTTRLTNNNRVSFGSISPDGKYVCYMEDNILSVKQVATGSTLQLQPPGDVVYWGIFFSYDSNFIYYLVEDLKNPKGGVLYKIPVLGGTPEKLLEKAGGMSFSPDGKQMTFVRTDQFSGESYLMIADSEGKNERVLAARKKESAFLHSNWSPDGKIITVTVVNYVPGDSHFTITSFPSDGGPERPLTKHRWTYLFGIVWLPDSNGLIVNAKDSETRRSRLWYLNLSDDTLRIVTDDFNNYHGASVTADGDQLVSATSALLSNIWILPVGNTAPARQLTKGFGNYGFPAFTPDGKILFSTIMSGIEQILIMDADGSNQKQLTRGTSRNTMATISPDGRYIVFASARNGSSNIWRMDPDGGNLKQLSNGGADMEPSFSPDGKWVYFTAGDSGKWIVKKISIEGGEAVQLAEQASSPIVSPDGKMLAYDYYASDKVHRIAIMPLDGGPVKMIENLSSDRNIQWSSDGKGIAYLDRSTGNSEIWYRPIDGGAPKRLTNFKSDEIFWFHWSRDGKQALCVRGNLTSDLVLISNAK